MKPDFSVSSIAGTVFAVSYGGGHAAALAPVMARLREQCLPTAVLALTTARRNFDSVEVPCLGVNDLLLSVPGYRNVRRTGRVLARNQPQHSAVSVDETIAYLGAGFHALVKAHGLKQARNLYRERGRQAFRPVDFFLQLFRAQRPAVVVATSAPRSERAALEAARELGIPSVCVVDLYAPFEIEWCATPGYAHRICVLNDAVAARFVDRGVPRERLIATGNPAFDRLAFLDVSTLRQQARAERGIADDETLVVWISQPEPKLHPFSGVPGDPTLPVRIEHVLHQAYAGRPDTHLVLRFHPSEDRERSLVGARVRYSDASDPLDLLLCAADCIVTCSSTVGLEAAMLGIPVVQCMDSVFSPDLPLAEMGLAEAVPGHEEAVACIDRITAAPRRAPRADSPRLAHPHAADAIAQQVTGLFEAHSWIKR